MTWKTIRVAMMTDTVVPAWRVEIFWFSDIVGHLTGWLRDDERKDERSFRSYKRAVAYAERMTGTPSFLVPYMKRKGVVVETTRSLGRRDHLRAMFNMKPVWLEGR
jgi:hypothetical protein